MSVLPDGRQWLSHQGKRQRLRVVRQRMARVEKMKDEASRAALARIRASVADEPDPEYAAMHLVHVAMLAAEGIAKGDESHGIEPTPCTWAEAANHLMNRFDARAGAEE